MRNEEARSAWRAAVATRDAEQFVFVDESGTHTALTRLYGWAPHDQRATGSVPRNHGKNTTLVAALTPAGLQEPWLIEGAMKTETCEWYIRAELAPRLRAGQVVVLDNLSVHKAASIRQALDARGCELLFLPPSSPDFTPIEQAFSKLKAILRGLGARSREALEQICKRLNRRAALAHATMPASSPDASLTFLRIAVGGFLHKSGRYSRQRRHCDSGRGRAAAARRGRRCRTRTSSRHRGPQ